MTVTGQFKGGQIRIPKVTGDVEIIVNSFIDTSPVCTDGYGYAGVSGDSIADKIVTRNNFSITPIIFIGTDNPGSVATLTDQYLNIAYKFPKDSNVSVDSYYTRAVIPYIDGTVGTFSVSFDNVGDDTVRTLKPTAKTADQIDKIAFTLATAHIDDSYAYRMGDGLVIFAGRNTPYYGKRYVNI